MFVLFRDDYVINANRIIAFWKYRDGDKACIAYELNICGARSEKEEFDCEELRDYRFKSLLGWLNDSE